MTVFYSAAVCVVFANGRGEDVLIAVVSSVWPQAGCWQVWLAGRHHRAGGRRQRQQVRGEALLLLLLLLLLMTVDAVGTFAYLYPIFMHA